jgi:hypothetical protein
MKLLRTLFRSRARQSLRICDDLPHLRPQYGGEFIIEGLTVFDRQGRLRGFVFEPGDPGPARIQSFVAGARQAGHISDDLVRTLFSHIQRQDFVVKRYWSRDVLVFPSDIYRSYRSRSAQ